MKGINWLAVAALAAIAVNCIAPVSCASIDPTSCGANVVNVLAGTTLSLEIAPQRTGWTYTWSAVGPNEDTAAYRTDLFATFTTGKITFAAPPVTGIYKVTVTAGPSPQSCKDTECYIINVVAAQCPEPVSYCETDTMAQICRVSGVIDDTKVHYNWYLYEGNQDLPASLATAMGPTTWTTLDSLCYTLPKDDMQIADGATVYETYTLVLETTDRANPPVVLARCKIYPITIYNTAEITGITATSE